MAIGGPAGSTVRPYQSADREAASALLGDVRPLDAPGSHVHLSGQGAVDGVALWLEPPDAGGEAYLGPVIAPGPGPNARFYQLVLACAEDALARGHDRGYFTLKDRGLLRLLKLTFRIDPAPAGWEPEGGQPREWEVHVDLRDAIEQLRDIITRLGGSAA